ncbi:MAG: Glyoxalase/bleomycin resistance protein/dioxygenase [Fusobacteria bacterium]|nr:MAG: Glyoxalase/bleomycin resistance protein/dioxygenase [Fusobacteriota bacterium]KAF0228584.1 MAG: Glyoxalase/bleomycin resistance [Fusobacteriota bacterium]
MKEIKGIAHVCITVNDMDETLQFYLDVLGCKLVDRFQLDWVNVELAHVEINGQFIEFTYKSDTPRLRTDRWEVGHIAFTVSDINKVAENLSFISNIKFIDEKPNVVTETLSTFFIEGPSGEVIEFMEYK